MPASAQTTSKTAPRAVTKTPGRAVVYSGGVFVVMASLTMHASNGFLHGMFGGGLNRVLSPIDTAIGMAGEIPSLAALGALTGVMTGGVFWLLARPEKRFRPRAEPKEAKAKTAPRDVHREKREIK